MFGRRKRPEKTRGDKYLNQFDNIIGNLTEKTKQRLSDEELEALRREGRKWASKIKMKTYREVRKHMKEHPSEDYDIGYYGQDLSMTDLKRKAKADELMERNSLEDIKLAMELYKKVEIGSDSRAWYHGIRSYADKPAVKRKIINFIRRVQDRYSPKELAQLRVYLESTEGGLERKTFMILGIAGIIVSSFFLSPLFTGNVIGNIVLRESSIIGGVIFVLSLFSLFISFRH